MPECQLGDLETAGGAPHGAEKQADPDSATLTPVPQPGHRGLDHPVERHAALHIQLGSEPDLGVHHTVVRQVLGAFGRHPVHSPISLHDANGVAEHLQVELQAAAASAILDPGRQLPRIVGRKTRVAGVPGEINDRGGSQPAIEVIMQHYFRRLSQPLERRSSG